MKNKQTELWTALDVAVAWKIKPDTVRSWARRGLIPAIRPTPKVLRFDPVAVREALVDRATAASPHAIEARRAARRGGVE